MTVKEFYDGIGGNYDEAVGRLMNDPLVKKFVLKFPADKSFEELKAALSDGRTDDAFSAAHTLKGVTLNLSFARLSQAAVKITDALRPQNRADFSADDVAALFASLETEYTAVITAIARLCLSVPKDT